MGHWTIIIAGAGPHHNKDYERDADRIFRKMVQELKEAGHRIDHASITCGGRDEYPEKLS
jgi:GH35 family endo-1,4-beta-xylanase